MNHDMVFWGVAIAFGGSALVLLWLCIMLIKNASKPSGSK